MDFKVFAQAVENHFNKMAKKDLYTVTVDKNELWELYLASFPEGTNLIYKERTEYDCNCCKNFIRGVGAVVTIENNKLVSIWDITVGEGFQPIADALAAFVKKQKIDTPFSFHSTTAGVKHTRQQLEDKSIKTWNHFFCKIPKTYVDATPEQLGGFKATKHVFERGLKEITKESLDIVLELIDQKSLYKGDEYKTSIQSFRKLKIEFDKITNEAEKDNFCWSNYTMFGARIKNDVQGTLLMDISEGKPLDLAVKAFETKVAPANYKRTTALITKGMIEQAMKKIEELDIKDSLYRRFATAQDLSVNNVLFADKSTAADMKDSLLDALMQQAKPSTQNYSKVEEVSIEDFIKLIPTINEMEVMFENKHTPNLMSLIAPKYDDTPNILKWGNNFSWSYNGNVTDSIKEKVKRAGGNINGVLRISLSWFNYDDLDLHVREPGGNHIYHGNSGQIHPSSGVLDVDMNIRANGSREAVENIVWTNKSKMKKKGYQVYVNNYTKRETIDVGFTVEMEYNGQITTYSYNKAVRGKENVPVMDFNFDGEKITDIKLGKNIINKAKSQEIWGVNTEKFQKVSLLTISPNFWDENENGHKHYFFILEKCLNPDRTRGFYNEFLRSDLAPHRKVFEVLGNETKCEESTEQLSGLGFSSTKRDSVIVKVTGNFSRTLKINF